MTWATGAHEFLHSLFDANVLYPAYQRYSDAASPSRTFSAPNPPFTATEYLEVLKQHGLVATAAELAQFSNLI
jgi:hypothetical protein